MSRGLGRIQRECLRVIENYEAAGEGPTTTFTIAAEVYQVKPDRRGNRTINDAQHVATKRALASLRRKGLVFGHQDIKILADGRRILARQGADGQHAERCCLWSTVEPITRKQRVAYHEAGHAVVGQLLGYKIMSVSMRIYNNDPQAVSGLTTWLLPHPERCRKHIAEVKRNCPDIEAAVEIVVALAGLFAELRISPDKVANEYEWSFSLDQKDIFKRLKKMGCSDADLRRIMEPLMSICRRWIEDHWSQIDALAKALLADKKIIKEKDIQRILGPPTIPLRKVTNELARALEQARVGLPSLPMR